MKFGIHFWNYTFPGGTPTIQPELAATARAADQAGFELFTVMDHWFQMDRVKPAEEPMLEAYTTLGYVAALTERIQLATLVTGVTYRYPALLAKTVTTLDVLSGGRAWLGIGAAWYEREHLGLGVPYPAISERFERLEEALQLCLQMWGDEVAPYHGKHFQLEETLNSPQPIRRPPILIGGGGERKTLRLVAKYADACNLFAPNDEELAHKIDVLREHCVREGRALSDIRITVLAGAEETADPDAFLRRLEVWAALGVSLVSFRAPAAPAAFVSEFGDSLLGRAAAIG
ncbi:LLM class F420-dependent oxidoreductase [Protaetiibacter larvae]|uniref:LLM class F420-dependent oxidoreductase n=1 Tax=Protaetiibacter larvae TaxID=2592654 RepID=A0A5C1Y919_9MICO|nr:LLM class F420-dependent oxidoreductase [Protaetiibacter larvae]QEO10464.1 LLM class F420-dependent oxidoreductase [Protaetiibacter larvae]